MENRILKLIEDMYEHNISKSLAYQELVDIINDLSEHTEGKYGKDGSMNCGEVALKYGLPVGEIGCPKCGSISSGLLREPVCKICDNSLYEHGLNSILKKLEDLSYKEMEYDIKLAENKSTGNKIIDLEDAKDLICELFGYSKSEINII